MKLMSITLSSTIQQDKDCIEFSEALYRVTPDLDGFVNCINTIYKS